jgi:hypothetical protein
VVSRGHSHLPIALLCFAASCWWQMEAQVLTSGLYISPNKFYSWSFELDFSDQSQLCMASQRGSDRFFDVFSRVFSVKCKELFALSSLCKVLTAYVHVP